MIDNILSALAYTLKFHRIVRHYLLIIFNRMVKLIGNKLMVKYLPFYPPPPPGLARFNWWEAKFVNPFFRAVERAGVYFYNNVIHRSEIGLYHKNYNPKVHGPYRPYTWYGKRKFFALNKL